MAHDIPKILRLLMDTLPATQAQLAERLTERRKGGVKVDQSLISRWLKGVVPETPKYNRLIEVATDAGVIGDVRSEDVAEAIERVPGRMIPVKGYVGAGSEISIYNVGNAGDLDTIEASDRDTNQTVALRIIGSSLGKFFNRWYVCYDDVRSPITDDLIGELCVVGLSDDRVFIKKIARRGRTNRFDLLSNAENEDPIENVTIEWAAKVTDLRPG